MADVADKPARNHCSMSDDPQNAGEDVVKKPRRIRRLRRTGDVKLTIHRSTRDQLFAPVNELATELGLDACA